MKRYFMKINEHLARKIIYSKRIIVKLITYFLIKIGANFVEFLGFVLIEKYSIQAVY